MRITFLGATGTVTGSKYLVETADARVLVDCGLFQGWKSLRDRNWAEPPFDPSTLDAVILTHAHIDHTGYLPKLVKLGFRGHAYCTSGTRDLLRILLPDSGHLQEDAARHANAKGYSRHRPALPLYTRQDAEASLEHLRSVEFHSDFTPAAGLKCSFTRAGHIVGSACLNLRADGVRVTFSGDVGRPGDPIMKPAEPLSETDYLVVESTYGDRRHSPDNVLELLAKVVNETVAKKGTIVVPAFAVGRAQHLLHLLDELMRAGRIPRVPVFLDSPMAIDATGLFCKHKDDHGLSDRDCRSLCTLARYTRTSDESKAIDAGGETAIIISASGMATGGRVLHHLRRFLPDERSTILIVGYQASGTRGRTLVDGAHELSLFGQYVPVKARVVQIDGLSAHADYEEMLAWLRASDLHPKQVFVTHGEPAAADAFRQHLVDTFSWNVGVPTDGSSFVLGEEPAPRQAPMA